MGTIADKLTYLSDTKVAIRNSIINAGGTIPIGTAFRNYAGIIDSYLQIGGVPMYLNNNSGFTESSSTPLPGQNSTSWGTYTTVKNGYGIVQRPFTGTGNNDNFVLIYNESTKATTNLSVGANSPIILLDWDTGKPVVYNDEIFLACYNINAPNNILSRLSLADLSTHTPVTVPLNYSIYSQVIQNLGNVYMHPLYVNNVQTPGAVVLKYDLASHTFTSIGYTSVISSAFGSDYAYRFNFLLPLSGINNKCLAMVYNGTYMGICQIDLSEGTISGSVYLNSIGGTSGFYNPIVTDEYIYLFPSGYVGGTGNLSIVRIKRGQEFNASSYDTVTFTAIGSSGTDRAILTYGMFRPVKIKNLAGVEVYKNSLFIPSFCHQVGNILKTIVVDTLKKEFYTVSFSSQGLYAGTDNQGGTFDINSDRGGYVGFCEDFNNNQPVLLSLWRNVSSSTPDANTTVMWHAKFS